MSEVKETREKNPVFVKTGYAVLPLRWDIRVVWAYDDGHGETRATLQDLLLDANNDVLTEARDLSNNTVAGMEDNDVCALWEWTIKLLNAFARPVLKYGPDDQTLEWITFAQALGEGMST